MPSIPRINRDYIERKAEEVLTWFNSNQLDEPRLTPVAEIVLRLAEKYGIAVLLDQDLGMSPRTWSLEARIVKCTAGNRRNCDALN